MSSGAFLNANYSTDLGNVVPISVQAETVALIIEGETNTVPAGPLTAGFPSAVVSRGKNAKGINARTVRVQFPPGGAPAGYSDRGAIELPWLSRATFDALPPRGTGTYLGSVVNYIGKSGESIK